MQDFVTALENNRAESLKTLLEVDKSLDELVEKLRDQKIELSHEEWDDVLMYIWQERCE